VNNFADYIAAWVLSN